MWYRQRIIWIYNLRRIMRNDLWGRLTRWTQADAADKMTRITCALPLSLRPDGGLLDELRRKRLELSTTWPGNRAQGGAAACVSRAITGMYIIGSMIESILVGIFAFSLFGAKLGVEINHCVLSRAAQLLIRCYMVDCTSMESIESSIKKSEHSVFVIQCWSWYLPDSQLFT